MYPRTGFKSYVRGFGSITATSVTTTGNVTSGGQFLAADGSSGAPGYAFANDPDSGYYRAGSGDTRMSSNNGDRHAFNTTSSTASGLFVMAGTAQVSGGNLIIASTRNVVMQGGYIELIEIAAPGAGAANTARIYAVVDGGSLTDAAVVFQDGTVDIFAQET